MACHTSLEDCEDLDLKNSRSWLRIAIACVFAGQGMVFSLALNMTPPPFASPAYLILHGGLILSALIVMGALGVPLFSSTYQMLQERRISIESLFTLSLLAAFVGSVVGSFTGRGDVFYEVVSVVIAIYTFGQMLRQRSRANLKRESELLKDKFNHAIVRIDSGEWVEKPISEVRSGEFVRVDPGTCFSVDGTILEGTGYVDETALTGEPLPVIRNVGDKVQAGTWSVDCRFILKAELIKGCRELDKIFMALNSHESQPSEFQSKANDLIKYFLPFVVFVSLCTALYWFVMGTWEDSVLNSMTVLLIACPCALGLATPVAISQGLFRLAQMGLVSRDGALIDALAHTRQVYFDKTGTLSESSLQVQEVWTKEVLPIERSRLMSAVVDAQSTIKHPIARALCNYINNSNRSTNEKIHNLRLIPGLGIEFFLENGNSNNRVLVGDEDLSDSSAAIKKVINELQEKKGKRVFVWYNSELVSCFVLRERLRKGVENVFRELRELKINAQVLTGDPSPDIILPEIIDMKVGLSFTQKVKSVSNARENKKFPLFVGDGINDAAAMTAASGSIAIDTGAGLARSAAMGILSSNRIIAIPNAILLARSIHKRLRSNLLFAAIYNIVGVFLAVVGVLTPIIAAVIMLSSSFIVMSRAVGQYHCFKKY